MQVPIMSEELAALLAASSAGFDPRTIPLTHAASGHGDYAIDSEAVGADASWALAHLAIMRQAAVSQPGNRRLTDKEAQSLRTIMSGSFAACPPDATDTDRIATVAANVRGWLDTLT